MTRILITNIQFAIRSGTEIVVRDLALRLNERSHDVTVYSPALGELANDLKSSSITVIDDLAMMQQAPDIIHGHHTPTTVEAIVAFPSTPAIWVCHDARSWFDRVPRFSQVRRLFAVDDACRGSIMQYDGIPIERIDILPNAVDLRTFTLRPEPLPEKPSRAVSLVKHSAPIAMILDACQRTGVAIEAYGHGVGRPVADIQRLSANADIVFATARTALEAMATGAAVILVDGRGFGGLVTSENFDVGRRFNFGLGVLKQDTTVDLLLHSIASFDAADAAKVCARVRSEADLDNLVCRLEAIYDETIEEAKAGGPVDAETFRREQIAFNRLWLPNTLMSLSSWLEERTAMSAEMDDLHRRYHEQEHERGRREAAHWADRSSLTGDIENLRLRIDEQDTAIAKAGHSLAAGSEQHQSLISALEVANCMQVMQQAEIDRLHHDLAKSSATLYSLQGQFAKTVQTYENARSIRIARWLRRFLPV